MTAAIENNSKAGRSRLLRLFANPWIGIAGSVASLLSVGLALYFYVASIRYPELVYYVSPARAVVVKQGTASRLAVSFDGRPIAQDVTATQVAFWNRGKEPIRRGAMLQPFVVRTQGKVRILEATLRKKSREVLQVDLDQSKIADGELELSWNILETGDGGVLQIVYAGGPDVRIQCTGVLEGQPAIRELRYSGTIKSPSEQMRSERLMVWAVIGNGLLAIVMLVFGLVRLKSRGLSRLRTRNGRGLADFVATVVMPLVMISLVAYMYATSTVPDPPFGFD